jgi:hypothetical protein
LKCKKTLSEKPKIVKIEQNKKLGFVSGNEIELAPK